MNKNRVIWGGFPFIILLLLASLWVLTLRFMNDLSLKEVKAAIDSLGEMASVVFIGVCVVRGVIFIPCGLLSALGGMLFGPLWGTIFALGGLTAGSVITFCMARGFGKSWAQRVMGCKYDKYEGYISKDYFYSIFLMRVVPIIPYDAVSCIAGISGTRVGIFILATLLGSLPGVFVYVFFGDSLRSMSIKRVVFSATIMAIFAILPFCYRKLIKLIQRLI